MDQDLKQYLDAKTSNLEKLIVDVKDSLEREMRTGFAEVKTRFDTQAARLERQGALIQTGSRWTVRMNEWTEKIDAAFEARDQQIEDLRARLKKLEDDRKAS